MPGYGDAPTSIWRRYNEFELLRTYLEVMYPAVVSPPLPEKRVSCCRFLFSSKNTHYVHFCTICLLITVRILVQSQGLGI